MEWRGYLFYITTTLKGIFAMTETRNNVAIKPPSFAMMLVKYPPYFTGKFNAIALPVLAVLLLLIPISRELRMSDLALPIAIVWLVDLVAGVPFALYVTYLDYRLAQDAYRSEAKKK